MANPARRDASAPPTSTADDSRRVRFVAPVRGPYLDGTSLDLLVPSRSSSPPALPPTDSSHSSVWASDDARNDARLARGSYLLPLPVVPPRAVVAAIAEIVSCGKTRLLRYVRTAYLYRHSETLLT